MKIVYKPTQTILTVTLHSSVCSYMRLLSGSDGSDTQLLIEPMTTLRETVVYLKTMNRYTQGKCL